MERFCSKKKKSGVRPDSSFVIRKNQILPSAAQKPGDEQQEQNDSYQYHSSPIHATPPSHYMTEGGHWSLEDWNPRFFQFLQVLVAPKGDLDFAYVDLLQHHEAKTALADSAAD